MEGSPINIIYIIDIEISSRKKDYVKMIHKMHLSIGNANSENSLVKKTLFVKSQTQSTKTH